MKKLTKAQKQAQLDILDKIIDENSYQTRINAKKERIRLARELNNG